MQICARLVRVEKRHVQLRCFVTGHGIVYQQYVEGFATRSSRTRLLNPVHQRCDIEALGCLETEDPNHGHRKLWLGNPAACCEDWVELCCRQINHNLFGAEMYSCLELIKATLENRKHNPSFILLVMASRGAKLADDFFFNSPMQ